jgi:hypothetical protein
MWATEGASAEGTRYPVTKISPDKPTENASTSSPLVKTIPRTKGVITFPTLPPAASVRFTGVPPEHPEDVVSAQRLTLLSE